MVWHFSNVRLLAPLSRWPPVLLCGPGCRLPAESVLLRVRPKLSVESQNMGLVWCVRPSFLSVFWNLHFSGNKEEFNPFLSIFTCCFASCGQNRCVCVVKNVQSKYRWENLRKFWDFTMKCPRKTNLSNSQKVVCGHRTDIFSHTGEIRDGREKSIGVVAGAGPILWNLGMRKIILQGKTTECQLWNVMFSWHGGQRHLYKSTFGAASSGPNQICDVTPTCSRRQHMVSPEHGLLWVGARRKASPY